MTKILFLFFTLVSIEAIESVTWQNFKDKSRNALPDYSYAGYDYGEKAIPHIKSKIFNVLQYGAIPNDGKSDRQAIIKAINAAEENGAGVVFFPKGQFLINEHKGNPNSIFIRKSNIILRGSGSNSKGTVLFMKEALKNNTPHKMWKTPPLFNFSLPYSKSPIATKITQDSSKGSFHIQVANSSMLRVGQTVILKMKSKNATASFLQEQNAREIWGTLNTGGMQVQEMHSIRAINGTSLELQEPLGTDVVATWNWSITPRKMAHHWGVENIHFKGNFLEKFQHHKNTTHDSGWTAISMHSAYNSWIQRCRFSNFSQVGTLKNCRASSLLFNIIDGNRGHFSFSSTGGYGNLIGCTLDKTNHGMYHGPGTSNFNVGLVIWRYRSLKGGGPDFHGYFPYKTLWDLSSATLVNNGGHYNHLPNHFADFTYWNFQQTGKAKHQHNFWALPQTAKQKQSKYFGGAKVVKPHIIGFHGSSTSFKKESLGLSESIGKPVEPASLYEAQLKWRLNENPLWLSHAVDDWSIQLNLELAQ